MRYAFLFISFLVLPSVSYGMEDGSDLETAEEGRSGTDFEEQLKRLKAIVDEKTLEGISRHIGILSDESKKALHSSLEQFEGGAGREGLYLLSLLHQDGCKKMLLAEEEFKELQKKNLALIKNLRRQRCKRFCEVMSTLSFTCATIGLISLGIVRLVRWFN